MGGRRELVGDPSATDVRKTADRANRRSAHQMHRTGIRRIASLPATDTVAAGDVAPASTAPSLLVMAILAATFVGGLSLVAVRNRR